MDLDSLLKQLREEDRAVENCLGADFRAEVLAQIDKQLQRLPRPSKVELKQEQGWLDSFCNLLREPGWIVAVLLLAATVAAVVHSGTHPESMRTERRAMLSLDTFDPLAPHTPERLLTSRFSNEK
jgi:hypothetical protein